MYFRSELKTDQTNSERVILLTDPFLSLDNQILWKTGEPISLVRSNQMPTLVLAVTNNCASAYSLYSIN